MENSHKIIKSPVFLDWLAILTLFIICILIVNPLGDFPLNDDWSFARTLKRLIDLHMYVPTGWTAMSLLTNILWGWLFCLPEGFSFNALRMSTLVAAFAGGLGIYLGAKDLGADRFHRATAVLILVFNPIYFVLSFTFMTDVLFAVLAAMSALFFLRYLKRETAADFIAATCFALVAILSRQLGVAIPLAFAISYITLRGIGFRSIIRASLPFLICVGALIFYQHWLSETGRMTALYDGQNAKLWAKLQTPKLLIQSELINSYIALLYIGLFLLPLLLLALPAIWRGSRLAVRGICIAAVLVGASTYIFSRYIGEPRLPLLGNILDKFGIGPLTLRDTYIMGASVPQLPSKFWLSITGLALFGGVLLLFIFIEFIFTLAVEVRQRKVTQHTALTFFLWLAALIYLVAIFTSQLFDRYLLPVVPLLSLAVLSTFSESKIQPNITFKTGAITLALAFVFFSVCTARDYLTWNRARWQALTELTQIQNVQNQNIDGGFEFNGFYLYDRNYRGRYNKSWWWVEDDTYVISFNPMPGYTIIREYPYSHWLPRYEAKILVLKKIGF